MSGQEITYIPRSLEPVLLEAGQQFPAVTLTGPRQSGKTTLVQHLFSRTHRYVSLQLPDVQQAARSDPRGFMSLNTPPVVLDEIQHCPDLLPYVMEAIDQHRSRTGQFILTGSQNLLLLKTVSETLAGRTAVLRLLPLSWRERTGQARASLPWDINGRSTDRPKISLRELWEGMLRGGYPELTARSGLDPHLWHASYIQTYLERDVRGLRQVGDLTEFQRFLQLLAARSANLLNMTSLSRDLGVAVNTVKAWLGVLEASHQVTLLRPFAANIGKRLVKSPKVYFSDVGTLCHLVGLRSIEHAMAGPMAGAIMETAVLAEIQRTQLHQGRVPRLHFFRTASGAEVDIVVEADTTLVPVEVKCSATLKPAMGDGILTMQRLIGKQVSQGYVIYPGDEVMPLGPGVIGWPFAKM